MQEIASAIGTAGCWGLGGDADVQCIAANTIGAYMTKVVVHRTHTRFLQAAGRLTTGEVAPGRACRGTLHDAVTAAAPDSE